MNLFDTDMTLLGPATDEQIAAADTAEGGWIWIDREGAPVPTLDHDIDEGWLSVGTPGGTSLRVEIDGHRRVCVA